MPHTRRRNRVNARADSSDEEIQTDTVNTAPDRRTNIQRILQQLQGECESERGYAEVLRQFLQIDTGQRTITAPVAAAGRGRRPSTFQIPIYESKPPGKEGFISIELFLKTVHRETRVGDFEDAERIMIARDHIRGAARIMFDNANLLEETRWSRFDEKMKEIFAIPRDKLVEKLHELMIYRKSGEPLRDYIGRISSELNNYSPTGDMPDEEKVIHMKRILRTTLPKEMRFPLELAQNYDNLITFLLAYAAGQTTARLTEEDIEKEKEEITQKGVRKDIPTPSAVAAAGVSKSLQASKDDDNEGGWGPPANQREAQTTGSRETPGFSSRGRSYRGRGRGTPRHLYCDGCGGNHARTTCLRSRHVTCYHCGTVGHFSFVCRKNGPRATEPFPVAASNSMAGTNQQRPWAPTQHYQTPIQYPMAPSHAYRAPMLRPPAPFQRPSAPAHAVAAAPMQWASQGTFPWEEQQQPARSTPEEYQQQ